MKIEENKKERTKTILKFSSKVQTFTCWVSLRSIFRCHFIVREIFPSWFFFPFGLWSFHIILLKKKEKILQAQHLLSSDAIRVCVWVCMCRTGNVDSVQKRHCVWKFMKATTQWRRWTFDFSIASFSFSLDWHENDEEEKKQHHFNGFIDPRVVFLCFFFFVLLWFVVTGENFHTVTNQQQANGCIIVGRCTKMSSSRFFFLSQNWFIHFILIHF